MAERLSRVETKERKEKKAHPMQLKYDYDAKSRKYTEKYIRAKKVSSPGLLGVIFNDTCLQCAQTRPAKEVSLWKTRITAFEFTSQELHWLKQRLDAHLQVTGEAQTEYLKALAERCATRQRQTEEALRQKYLKPLNADTKRVNKAGMEEHLAKLQRLFQGQGVVDRPAKG